jgi:hypothetical protein
MLYEVYVTLNPNAINPKYGRTKDMCDTHEYYSTIEAESHGAAMMRITEEPMSYGYPHYFFSHFEVAE